MMLSNSLLKVMLLFPYFSTLHIFFAVIFFAHSIWKNINHYFRKKRNIAFTFAGFSLLSGLVSRASSWIVGKSICFCHKYAFSIFYIFSLMVGFLLLFVAFSNK
jgi:hypothetical protein